MARSQRAKFSYEKAKEYLVTLFEQAESDYANKQPPFVSHSIIESVDVLFASPTQSYREVLLGCGLVRLVDRTLNIRHPYINQGPDAFNGRTLDEQVINPFLHDRMIPASKGPYLATFRRSVRFVPDTVQGLRDKRGYLAFLDVLSEFERARTDDEVSALLRYLLYRFIALRDAAVIPLSKVARLSLDQYEWLIDGLLQTPSGGLLPVLLTVAMFQTIRQCYNLNWDINWQGINVADAASGTGGDITIRQAGQILLAIEVTERPIDQYRVISTFNTKISPQGIEDYLFFSTGDVPSEARTIALQYFAQGHDVNFLQVKPWLVNNLGTIGARCRRIFTNEFLRLMDSRDVPATLKVAWNDLVKKLFS